MSAPPLRGRGNKAGCLLDKLTASAVPLSRTPHDFLLLRPVFSVSFASSFRSGIRFLTEITAKYTGNQDQEGFVTTTPTQHQHGRSLQDVARRHLPRRRSRGADRTMEQPPLDVQKHIRQACGFRQQKSRQSEHHWRGKLCTRHINQPTYI